MTEILPTLDKHPQALQLSFWIVVVAAGIEVVQGVSANVEFYQTRLVAYTKQEAITAALKQLQAEVPALWDRGQALGGWRVTHVDGVSATDMEKMFKERADRERALEKDRVHMEHNALLSQIIATNDIRLFHQAIRDGRINNYERYYVHEKLTEGKPTAVPEQYKSPYQDML